MMYKLIYGKLQPAQRHARAALFVVLIAVGSLVPVAPLPRGTPAVLAASSPSAPSQSGWVLATDTFTRDYAPTVVGNGYMAARIPAEGMGSSTRPVPAQSQVAGFYAHAPGEVEQRANVPTWSTLAFFDGSATYSTATGRIRAYHQSLDLKRGLLTTTLTWVSPVGKRSDLTYLVLVDQASEHAAVVQLLVRPYWSGTASVTDLIDGTDATLTTESGKGWDARTPSDWVTVSTLDTNIQAALASTLTFSPNVKPAVLRRVGAGQPQTIGQQVTFPVSAGETYTLTKYVGVATSQEASAPLQTARGTSARGAALGFHRLLDEHVAAWAQLWQSDIEVEGNPTLQAEVRASLFYLLESTHAGIAWSIAPGGLSSNGYNGHIFWDAETWMYPPLLLTHPDIAKGMNVYRQVRLPPARAYAVTTGYQGARFPWESALTGTEQVPDPSVNTTGRYEQHITADVALAQWQYYLASGDRHWLARRGWPVLKEAADFWASRVTAGRTGGYDINGVTGPDEDHPDVNNEVYTNVAAALTLRLASAAARISGQQAPARWLQVASGLKVLFDPKLKIHPEFEGYHGSTIKQADVVMLTYPWEDPMPAAVAQADLNYYASRVSLKGPSMTDSIHAIDSLALNIPGCTSYTFVRRSIEPFIRAPFDQFSEARQGGAFTFMTGAGGFLQTFLYGFSGFRWRQDRVHLDPSLTSPLTGITLRHLAWQGRRFDVAIGPQITRITLLSGAPMRLEAPGVDRILQTGASLLVRTRRPDQTPSANFARC